MFDPVKHGFDPSQIPTGVGILGSHIFLSTCKALFVSDDDGKTWAQIEKVTSQDKINRVTSIAIANQTIFLGATVSRTIVGVEKDEKVILKSDDKGGNWDIIPFGEKILIGGEPVGSFEVRGMGISQVSPKTTFYASSGKRDGGSEWITNRLFKTIDGGNHWEELEIPISKGSWIQAFAYDSHADYLYVVVDIREDQEYRISQLLIRDGTGSWSKIENATMYERDGISVPIFGKLPSQRGIESDGIRAMKVVRNQDDMFLYAGTDMGRVIKSSDGGQTWMLVGKPVGKPFNNEIGAIDVIPTSEKFKIYVAIRQKLLVADEGERWELLSEVPPPTQEETKKSDLLESKTSIECDGFEVGSVTESKARESDSRELTQEQKTNKLPQTTEPERQDAARKWETAKKQEVFIKTAYDVFISYSSKDKSVADAICNELEHNGVRCWIAPRDISPGQDWSEAIVNAIENSRIMVLVLSSESNASRHVIREVERAVNKAVIIIPFRIEDISLSKSMEYFIGSIHWLDALIPPIERHIQQLVESVKSLLSRTPSGTSSTADKILSRIGLRGKRMKRDATPEKKPEPIKTQQRENKNITGQKAIVSLKSGDMVEVYEPGFLWEAQGYVMIGPTGTSALKVDKLCLEEKGIISRYSLSEGQIEELRFLNVDRKDGISLEIKTCVGKRHKGRLLPPKQSDLPGGQISYSISERAIPEFGGKNEEGASVEIKIERISKVQIC